MYSVPSIACQVPLLSQCFRSTSLPVHFDNYEVPKPEHELPTAPAVLQSALKAGTAAHPVGIDFEASSPMTSWTAISDPPSPYERMTSTTLGNFVNFILPPGHRLCMPAWWVSGWRRGGHHGAQWRLMYAWRVTAMPLGGEIAAGGTLLRSPRHQR